MLTIPQRALMRIIKNFTFKVLPTPKSVIDFFGLKIETNWQKIRWINNLV
jgi:hypothetical protein